MNKEYIESEFKFNMYTALMNILDTFAQYGKPLTEEWKEALNVIQREVSEDDEPIEEMIDSTADANDCGYCTTWEKLIAELRINMLKGERIRIKSSHKITVYDWETGEVVEYKEEEEE